MDCADIDAPEASALPEVDALIAGALARMTARADPCPQTRLSRPALRRVLARKRVSNRFLLQHHSQSRPGSRQALAQTRARRVVLAKGGAPVQEAPAGGANTMLH